ncbi:hypothetical protein RHMOL_Rhmol12G0000200 [Rhododendron molle]|uniref:Uncharacterized protein n=1 Tax=Rhododendron molle TaxID=49168 RepID=A0ACC0LDL2_RHOML|nr:hypothetical protein RHMOL_Rhmol12G0000200 [Rhododendron molle]
MSMGLGAITSCATSNATAIAAARLANNRQGHVSSSSVFRNQQLRRQVLVQSSLSSQHNKDARVSCLTNNDEPEVPSLSTRATSSSGSTASSSIGSSSSLGLSLEIREIDERCKKWQWRGYTINYLSVYGRREQVLNPDSNSNSDYPPLLLVHGFGASIAHWRRNIWTLAQSYTVYAIDLLGFGASDKPEGFSYTMDVWAQLILDFLDEIVQRPTILIGNSVGSLACVIAASDSSQSLVRGLVLLNCAGGMNNKAIVDDWRIRLLLPLLWVFDTLLKQRAIASFIFERVTQRDNLRNILLSVYGNKESVDEDLIEIIKKPANDEGALDAFVSIVTGPPGPNPVQLMPRITLPVLVLWGDRDPFTPLDGPVGTYFSTLPAQYNLGGRREDPNQAGYKWRMVIAYDGTRFSGWQYQPSPPTIQSIVEKALTQITKQERRDLHLVGASRTDTGVHAWGQVAHFVTPFNYERLDSIHAALNGLLPSDIRIREISPAAPEFHARFSVKSKIYHYKIYNSSIMDPFQRHYAYHNVYKLNSDVMREAAKHFIGKHDFSSFVNASRNDRSPDPVKNIFRFDITEMVALLLQIGREAIPPDIVPKILATRDRKELAKVALPAPPHGLCLVSVSYNEEHLRLPAGCPSISFGRHHSISKCKLPFF